VSAWLGTYPKDEKERMLKPVIDSNANFKNALVIIMLLFCPGLYILKKQAKDQSWWQCGPKLRSAAALLMG
jgi:hypothetical protein